jgi:membrane-anchored mycosin MYCP
VSTAVGGLLAVSSVALAAPARADDVDCTQVRSDSVPSPATSPSLPAALLDLAGAQALVRGEPGAGQTVAIVDSGIEDTPLLPEVEHPYRAGPVLDYHGTALAGLVAGRARAEGGPVGVVPAARLLDVRVYDESPVRTQGAQAPTAAGLAAGLEWVREHWRAERIGVVVIAVAVPDDPRLAGVVHDLVRADLVVVAASGNRPAGEGEPLFAEFGQRRPGEDAAGAVFPAGYPGVLAVSATAEGAPGIDARDQVLPNSATDLAAPTYAAVTVGLNGETCVLPQVATSWAAAEVGGVAALLRQRFPRETAAQVIARLLDTADGLPDTPTPMTGAGTVQPVEALTRPLSPAADGTLTTTAAQPDDTPRATAPRLGGSVLPEIRHSARWWILGGAALVVLALLLRPLLARRE